MKCLVIGCGSIGERHIRNLKIISAGDIIAYDSDSKRLDLVKQKHGVIIFNSIGEAFNQNPDIIFVCTPPSSHIQIAAEAIKNNAHVFIEKPMSHSLAGIDEIIKDAEKKGLLIFVGYNFRFNEGINLIKNIIDSNKIGKVIYARAEFGQYLPDWRPWQDYSKSYTARRDLGGGIILDGSHEIDYLRWLLGDADYVNAFAEKISNLVVDTEDVAEILIKLKSGALCEIHLDFIRQGYTRNCEITGEKGVVIWDFLEKIIKIYESDKKDWNIIKISDDVNTMYINEIKHVINTIKCGGKPLVDGLEGKKTLELALAAKESAENHKIIKL